MNVIDQIVYEHTKRVEWYVKGIGVHCLSPIVFSRMSTETIVEFYNVEMSFFRPLLLSENMTKPKSQTVKLVEIDLEKIEKGNVSVHWDNIDGIHLAIWEGKGPNKILSKTVLLPASLKEAIYSYADSMSPRKMY